TGINDGTATQHLTDDDLDVLVVDGYTLGAVNSLNLVDEVLLHATTAEKLEHVVCVSRTVHRTQTGGDVKTVVWAVLGRCVRVGFHRATNLSQALTLRQLLVDHVVRTVIRGNRQSPEVTFIGQ